MRAEPVTDAELVVQIPDDFKLLELMMDDLRHASSEFQPTNYWAIYEPRFLRELAEHGLTDMRRQKNRVFRSFGAVDFVHPIAELTFRNSRLFKKWPFNTKLGTKLATRFDQFMSRYIKVLDGLDFETYVRLGYSMAHEISRESNAKPLSDFSMSLAGNPDGVVNIHGKFYSRQMVQYYLQYAYVSRFEDFSNHSVIAELGCGMGRQTEILFRLHPDKTYLLFDIPPQLYVAEQYLKTVFGDKVVSYRETRNWKNLDDAQPGKIYMLGNFQMPLLQTREVDLFWNSASFHEMEPDVVSNYLNYVNETTKYVYLAENLNGGKKAKFKGDLGILQVTTLLDYCSSLSCYELIDKSPTLRINGRKLSDTNMMFRRRD